MIDNYKNILFYADGAKGELAALRRTYSFAERNGAKVTVIAVVDEVSTDDARLQRKMNQLQKTLIKDRGLQVDKLIAGINSTSKKHPSIKKQVVAGKSYVEVIKAASDGNFDLVAKSVSSPNMLKGIFGSDDIRLLHFCPTPVMVLKPSRKKYWRSILVAVDPSAENAEEAILNDSLLATGASITRSEDADLHVLHVQERSSAGADSPELEALKTASREKANSGMENLVLRYQDLPLEKHLVKGKPHTAISRFVKNNDVDLLVMGSVARSGLPGFFVGNTAEKILEHVDCSVLVLKPAGWKTPVS